MRKSIGMAVAAAMAMGQSLTFASVMRHMGAGETTPRASTGSSGGVPSHHRKRSGWSCAEVKRRKTRQRNKLRAKGQFRKAVR